MCIEGEADKLWDEFWPEPIIDGVNEPRFI
jgi:hypothetical protein